MKDKVAKLFAGKAPEYHELWYHEDESISYEFRRLLGERRRCIDWRDWDGKEHYEKVIFEVFGYQH